MRMGRDAERTAGDIVNAADETELVSILREYGEEPRARPIARAMIRARPLTTTTALADVVARVVGRGKPGHHPATRSKPRAGLACSSASIASPRPTTARTDCKGASF